MSHGIQEKDFQNKQRREIWSTLVILRACLFGQNQFLTVSLQITPNHLFEICSEAVNGKKTTKSAKLYILYF